MDKEHFEEYEDMLEIYNTFQDALEEMNKIDPRWSGSGDLYGQCVEIGLKDIIKRMNDVRKDMFKVWAKKRQEITQEFD